MPGRLNCTACGWSKIYSDDELVGMLRSQGKLKRNAEPDGELLAELVRVSAPSLACPDCDAVGLGMAEVNAQPDGGDWPGQRPCAACGRPIPPERLEALPQTTLCAACQEAEETGKAIDEPEYCPKCGSLLVAKPTTGAGLTRWRMVCTGSPPCRL